MLKRRNSPLRAIDGNGHFFDHVASEEWGLWREEKCEGEAWQSVVDELARFPTMENCAFYRVRGFFRQPRWSWSMRRSLSEITCIPAAKWRALVFPVSMSRPVDLKFVFYRPTHAKPPRLKATFAVEIDRSGFSDIPNRRVELESRYDEI